MGYASDDEDASLLWGHHRVAQEQKLRQRPNNSQRRQCIRGGVLCTIAGTLGGILLVALPHDRSTAPAFGGNPLADADVWTRHPYHSTSLAVMPKGPDAAALSRRFGSSIDRMFGRPASTALPTDPRTFLASQPAAPTGVTDAIEKAARDDRSYRALTLGNGLKVLLVSDPNSVVAAASVDVSVGSWHDPEDLPGLAHFNEHMMFFLPKEVYPRTDEFQAFLSEHGGFSNAFTADTHTNYCNRPARRARTPAIPLRPTFRPTARPASVGQNPLHTPPEPSPHTPPEPSLHTPPGGLRLRPVDFCCALRTDFSVNQDALKATLERFSLFFAAPTFDAVRWHVWTVT